MGRVVIRHRWDLSPKAAVRLQRELRGKVSLRDDFGLVKTVAGADVAFTRDKRDAIAGMILFSYPNLQEICRVHVQVPLRFPYVPGLLSFREGPALVAAFRKLKPIPDILLIDGQGYAHPRRLGIATHLGLYLDVPTIGCAKSRLCGEAREPGKKRGSRTWLKEGGEKVGVVLRTREAVKPIFVSSGHRVSIESAVKIVLRCHDGTRIPKPTREADHYVAELKRKM